jgi:hypothetical protein
MITAHDQIHTPFIGDEKMSGELYLKTPIQSSTFGDFFPIIIYYG